MSISSGNFGVVPILYLLSFDNLIRCLERVRVRVSVRVRVRERNTFFLEMLINFISIFLFQHSKQSEVKNAESLGKREYSGDKLNVPTVTEHLVSSSQESTECE